MGLLRDKSIMLTGSATGLGYSFTGELGTESVKFLIGEFGERQLQAAIDCILESHATAGRHVSDFIADSGLGTLVESVVPVLVEFGQLFMTVV